MALNPTTIPSLLQSFRGTNATAPRLTWYGPDTERVELSGRVLDNWVAKTANFLVDEFDAEPGTVVAVDMPVHWRSLVWLLATWAVGGTALTESCPLVTGLADSRFRADHANVVATTDPAAATAHAAGSGRAPYIVAVALPALAMRWTGDLPSGAMDYSGGVRAHADVFFADGAPDADAVAWESAASSATHAGLLSGAPIAASAPGAETSPAAGPERVLVLARDGWDAVVPAVLRTWGAGGSVVLLESSVEATDHLRSTENITAG